MICVVTGSREATEAQHAPLIEEALRVHLSPGDIVYHGAARGVDSIAAKLAKQLGFEVKAFPANWELYGRSAGVRRSYFMIDAALERAAELGCSTMCLAFPGNGRGTRLPRWHHHTMNYAELRQIPVNCYPLELG